MNSEHLPWHRIANYLLGGLFCFTIGYWVKNNLLIFNDKLIILQQQSSHLLIPLPIWCVNVVAGVLLLYALLLILPNFTVLQQRRFQSAVFCILLFICVLPLHKHLNTARFNDVRRLSDAYSLIIYSVGIALCFRGLFGRYPTFIHIIGSRIFLWIRNIPSYPFIIGVVAGAVLICSIISWHIFDGVPGTFDGCLYMFQARLFANGMLSAEIPPEPQFFGNALVILSDKWYTQFPPGYPAILAVGVLLRISWLVNPILGALTIAGIYLIANELYGNNTAKLSALLACASGFFLFMSSEFMAHTSTLLFITTAFLSFVWMVKKKRPLLSAMICGTALGIAILCRPYTTAWFCVYLGIAAIVMRKQLSIRHILIGAVPLIATGLAFLAYNAATTGHPLLFGYIALHGKEHLPGFHQDPWIEQPHTIVQGVKYLLGNLNGLNYYLFEWPVPSIFFIVLYLAFEKKETWDWMLVGWLSSLFIGQVFYFFNEFVFGPRFVYETLPAVILLTSKGITTSTQLLVDRLKTPSYTHARSIICFILTGLFLFAVLFNIPATAKSYQGKYYGEDITIHKYLNKNNVEQALVFVKGERTYRVHYPFNAPFAEPHIYAKDRKNENRKLAEKFPNYRYFIADEKDIVEVTIDEL
ncbi:MAG: glycosyltransferase family 39 protein [Candidatus Poribacteria bacterium]|nr:glycosyltransferase family 39 protein [Candidatus Poribacteria bacterium]